MKNALHKARTRRALLAVVCILALAIPAALMAMAEDPYTFFAETTFEGTGGTVPVSGGASEEIEGLSVLTSHTKYYSTTSVPDLTVTLNVSINAKYSSGGTIELPLNFTPTRAEYPDFDYGTDGEDGPADTMPAFFSLVTPTTTNVIVDSYDLTSKPGTLVIHLKPMGSAGFTTYGMYPIPLTFAFNHDWSQKVPKQTTLWNIEPKAFVKGELAASAAVVTVENLTDRQETMYNTFVYSNPIDQYYAAGVLTFTASDRDTNDGRQLLDHLYRNIWWIEIPTGSTPGDTITNFYTDFVELDYNSSGFDRYEKVNATNSFYSSRSLSLTPPVMTEGTTFEVRFGYECKLVNEKEVITRTAVVPFTKSDRPIWEVNLPSYGTYNFCGINDGNVTGTVNAIVAATSYNSTTAIKNTGLGPITGVSFVIYQATAGSPKVNFNSAQLVAMRDAAELTYPKWSQYKVQYEIFDTEDGSTELVDDVMGTWKPDGTGSANIPKVLTLPVLTATQYINEIIVTPMGAVDTLESEGVWPGRNGLYFQYVVKAWNNRTWPDGTTVPEWSTAATGWRVNYDNNSEKPNAYPDEGGTPAVHEGGGVSTYYCNGHCVYISMSSSNPTALPGSIVDYTINGNSAYGPANPQAKWENPRIMVRVPKFATLLDGAGNLVDTVDDTASFTGTYSTSTFDVKATLTGIDNSYHYYSFQTLDFTLLSGSGVFRIPVQFKVSDNALAGTYPQYVLASSYDATSFLLGYTQYNGMNSLKSTPDVEALFGLSPGDRYYANTATNGISANTSFVVPALPAILADVAIVAVQEGYTQAGDEVTMRLSLLNNGNTPLNNIRFYNILPQEGDNLGTSGTLNYVSISSSKTPTNSYWAIDGASMPTYGKHGTDNPDLQSFTPSGSGWSTSNKGADTKAVYFNFGTALVLQPGQSVDIDITFKVPEGATDQIAYNQFRYSAKQSTSTAIMNLNSDIAAFKTYQMNLEYKENLPTSPATPSSAAADMPPADDQGISATAYMGFGDAFDDNQDGLTVANATPKITGYTFAGWNDESDGSGTAYSASGAARNAAKNLVTFTGAGTATLYAQWDVNKHNIHYAYEGTAPAAAPAAPSGEAAVAFATSKTVAADPALDGYTFSGWATTDTDVTGSAFTMPDNAVAFTGSWSPNPNTSYTVEHYYVNANGTADTNPFDTEPFTGTTDTPVTAAPKTGLTGYIHDPAYPGTVASGTIAGNGSLTLKLYYRASTHAISYAYTGTVPQSAPAVPAGETGVGYGEGKTVAAVPSVTGYAFSGWKTTNAAVSGNAFTMPDNDVAFTGSWSIKTDVSYTVKYLEQTTNKVLAPDKAVTGQTFFSTVTEGAIAIKGYTVAAPASQTLSLNGYGLVMTFYYTANPATPTPAPTPQQVRVSFYNSLDNNSLIYSGLVSIGGSVTPPTPPEYDGYVFTGWQGVYENVQKNENVFTRYIQAETLSIKITKSWLAPAGTALPSVTVRLLRDGMQYRSLKLDGSEGWVGYFTDLPQTAADGHTYAYSVTENSLPGFTLVSVAGSPNETEGFTLTNRAGGANGQLKVTFVDWDGTELKHEYVAYGSSATPPQDPQRVRYSFTGWMGNWENVTHDEFVFARYGRAAYGVSRVAGVGEDGIAILDGAIPLAGGSVSNFGDCVE